MKHSLPLIALALAGCAADYAGLHSPEGSPGPSTTISAAEPVLRWESFPRRQDAAVLGENYDTRVSNVRYELRVWHDRDAEPLEIKGLTRPEWLIPAAFEPGRSYHWAARARFDLDGRPRVTQWTIRRGARGEEAALRPQFRLQRAP